MNKEKLDTVSREIVRFMRGRYILDEVGNGKDELKFRRGGKTILTIYFRENRFDFLIIFGKAEREKFELERNSYSKNICDIYDNSKTYHDGKWMMFPIDNLQILEEVKRLINIKKKPNRKPFSKENAIYGKCGHRCDLCIHYIGINDETRKDLEERLNRVYGKGDWSMRCSGCDTSDCHNQKEQCEALKCAAKKELDACVHCKIYPCKDTTAGYNLLEPKTNLADDVTWAILPFVPYQYGN